MVAARRNSFHGGLSLHLDKRMFLQWPSHLASFTMAKEYGKLTSGQFREVIGLLPEIRHRRAELSEVIAQMPREELNALLVRGYSWGEIYERSLIEHVAIAVIAFNYADTLSEALRTEDPQRYVLDHLDPGQDVSTHPAFERQALVGLAFSLQRTILSVMLFQRTLSGLVQEVREDDNMDSLFKAVRVDRTTMNCTTIADKIARAELRQDRHFFIRLRNALKGPTQKHWAAYCDLRYSLFVLRELGFNSMSDAQLEKLLVHDLKVYPNTPSARKNLRAQYHQSRKIKTI